MSCFSAKTTTSNMAEPNPTKHVNYNLGMVLGVDDFTQEFAYLSGRDQWLARDLVGYGTVRGLKISVESEGSKGPRISVEPGVAVSPRGQMICVPAAQCAYLKDWVAQHSEELSLQSPLLGEVQLYVVLCYRDCPTDNVPIAGEPCRSEDQLVAASRLTDDFSLELRLKSPNQREENAVRDFVAWLKLINVTDDVFSSTPLEEFLDAIRAAAAHWLTSPLSSPPSSPPDDFMVGSPPEFIHVHPADVCEYMRAAFRVWVTELRPKWIARWHGCASTHFDVDDQSEEDCVMLAELTVPIVLESPGVWTAADHPDVHVDEGRRPYVIHTRMLQEWLLCGCSCQSSPSSPPASPLASPLGSPPAPPLGSPPASPPDSPPAPPLDSPLASPLVGPLESLELRVTTITAGAPGARVRTTTLSRLDQCVICDTSAGNITIKLPLTSENHGRVFIIKRITTVPGIEARGATFTVSISSVSPRPTVDLIDGNKTVVLSAQNKFIQIVANGPRNAWHVIGSN